MKNDLQMKVAFGAAVFFMILFLPDKIPAQSLPEKSIVDTAVPMQSVQTQVYAADTFNVSPFFVPVKLRSTRISAIEDDSQDTKGLAEPCSVSIIRSKIKKDPTMPIVTVVACHWTNFESAEHPDCGSMCQLPASVQFKDNPRTIGVQFFVPGGIAMMIGTLGFISMLADIAGRASNDVFMSSASVAFSGLAIGGALVFEGFNKIRIHARWSNRYNLKTQQ